MTVISKSFLLIVTILLSSCSLFKSNILTPHPINSPIKKEISTILKVVIVSKAHVQVSQLLKKDVSCEKMKEVVSVRMFNFETKEKYPMISLCSKKSNRITVKTKSPVNIGTYFVDVDYSYDSDQMVDRPILLVSFEDPEYGSEEDALKDGATVWPENKKIKASVNYSTGDMTDWFALNAEKGRVDLTLIDKTNQNGFKATLYTFKEDSARVLSKRVLKHKKKFIAKIADKRDYYLEVKANYFSNASEYVVLRKDRPLVEIEKIKVIDLYPISKKASMVLLEIAEGLAEKTDVDIFGRLANGKFSKVGKCTISQVTDKYASCQLNKIIPQGIVTFEGRFNKE